MKDFPCKPPWTSFPGLSLLSAQVSQWATVIYCPNSAVLCQRLWLESLTLQLISMSSPSLMFFFTFLQILFYEPIACYLPDTEAAPQGIIFSPPSQRVASLMLSLKSLEQLHIGYLPCLPREICSGEESVPHCSNWDSLEFCSFFFLLQDKRRKNLPIWTGTWAFQSGINTWKHSGPTKKKSIFLERVDSPDFLNPKQMQMRICKSF